MSLGIIVTLMRNAVFTVFMLSAPILLAALLVGLMVAILQATTSIQEQTLTFVPKVFTILGMLSLLSGWMFAVMRNYAITVFSYISQIVQ